MNPENVWRRVLLALSMGGLFAGATLLSGGVCGGGGGMGYESQPVVPGK